MCLAVFLYGRAARGRRFAGCEHNETKNVPTRESVTANGNDKEKRE